MLRARDISMLAYFGSRELDATDWEQLCWQADPRYLVVSVNTAPDGLRAIIVVEWAPDS